MSPRSGAGPTLVAAAIAAFTSAARADVVDVRQGTNIAVAVDPASSTLVVDLLGGLWRLPTSGGGATMLMPPGSGIAQPRFAPDGRYVVVERNLDGNWDLWLLEIGTGVWRQLTDTPYAERYPDFLADGNGIVFTSDRGGREQLWTLRFPTDALRQLTDEPGSDRFPAVGADGRIAYVNTNDGQSGLRVLTAAPGGTTLQTSTAVIAAPSWRPGSAGPVLVYNVHDRETSDLEMLVEADIPIHRKLTRDEDVFVGRAAWLDHDEYIYAADGQLWRRRIGSFERRPVHLFAGVGVDRPGSGRLPGAGPAGEPQPATGIRDLSIHPDGRSIVFAALGDLWLHRGRTTRRLTDDPDVDVEPAFIADSDDVAFVSDRGGEFGLWRLDDGADRPRQVAATAGDVSDLRLSRDGTRAYFVLTPANPGESGPSVMAADLGNGTAPATPIVIGGPYDDPVRLRSVDGRLTVVGPGIVPDGRLDLGFAVTPDPDSPEARSALTGDAAPTWSVPRPEPLVIRVGRLFDGIGNTYRRHVDVHVRDGVITAVVGRDRLPAEGRVVDFSDATMLPGLIDVHAHHRRNTDRYAGVAWLENGVTTVREITADTAAALERAEAWASGRRPGPRLVVAAATTGDEAGAVSARPGAVTAGLAHALADADRAFGEDDDPALDADVRALPEGGTAIALSPLGATYQDTLAVLAGTGSFMSTGLAAALRRIGRGESRAELTGRLTSIIERAQRSFGRIAIGSDTPLVAIGAGYHQELEALVRGGVPAAQVLRWATAGGAMALGVDTELGTVESGKLADMVVIDGDPLARIADARRIVAVLKGGVVVVGQ